MAAVPSVGDWHTRSIVEVYGSGDVETRATARVRALLAAFDARFGVSKAGDDGDVIVARAPGRVNLIGEHIDYEGYGVLPMAIAKDVLVAMRQRRNADMTPARVIVANVDSARYLEASFAAEPTQAVNASQHSWANYFLCAYKGVYEEASTAVDTTIGLEVMVSGDVPQGAGLSSSSAFICASSVALMRTLGLSFERARVAAFTCTCERYVGVLSGGMDQAISIFAERGVAKYVTFDPVRTQDVALPAGVQFVIADSAAISEKAVSATDCYNARVLECRLAAVVLAICAASMSRDAAREKARTLADVETMLGSREAAIAAAEKLLHADVYSADEIVECIGCSLEDFCDGSKVHLDVVEAARNRGGFKLKDRALHVYREASRVENFRRVCAESRVDVAEKLGALMNESHESCARLYECSCPELDELVGVCRAAGAIGSRLTGAGWGGCTVSLIDSANAASFIREVEEKYYAPKNLAVANRIFATEPASGAALLAVP